MCEKSGRGNYIILFCLVDIPTDGDGSSHKWWSLAVKKWDNRMVRKREMVGLP